MSNSLYPRLAAQNMKKNGKYYLPYIITGIMSVSMFFIVFSLQASKSLSTVAGGNNLKILLVYALVVSALLFTVFLFYNQSFLIKRRKTEFGLYSVLGMEKKHISRMCMFESLYTTFICVIGGIVCGVVLSKLAYLGLMKLLHISTGLVFEFSWQAVSYTAILFVIIYILIFFNTVRQIYRSKTVDLLNSAAVGEKEPKAKWIVTLIGLASLGAGYGIALTTKNPVDAIPLFTLAVILVCIGTYCLFSSGSIHLLKLLKKNKNYYYKTKHFVSVSGMMYRMKQNAVGLGNICIFCTAVLVTISTTVSLYFGMEDVLRNRFPRNIVTEVDAVDQADVGNIRSIIDDATLEFGADKNSVVDYTGATLVAAQTGDNSFVGDSATAQSASSDDYTNLIMISLADYNRLTGKNETLNSNEVLLYELNGKIKGDTITLGDLTVNIKGRVDNVDLASGQMAMLFDTYYLIVPDEEFMTTAVTGITKGEQTEISKNWMYGFDTTISADKQIELTKSINEKLDNSEIEFEDFQVDSAEENRTDFYALYGGLLFIGIFFGIVFLCATVLIIYYKQISEGYDDKERFIIMQQVGMSKDEVKKAINSQVLTVFFLPLVTAFIHMAVAFPIMTKLLALLNLTNVSVFVIGLLCTVAAFAVMYAIVYSLTAKVYYRIVK